MSSVLEDLVRKLRTMDEESQQNVIRRVAERDGKAADFLRKTYGMERRGEKMEKIAGRIIDRFG